LFTARLPDEATVIAFIVFIGFRLQGLRWMT